MRIFLLTGLQTGSEFKAEEDLRIQGPPEYNRVQFSPYCYDAVWTLAYALNETLQGLLFQEHLALKKISVTFIIQAVTFNNYSNNDFHDRLYQLVNESNFIGVTVSSDIRFCMSSYRLLIINLSMH